jgi:hypothetical protein
MAPNGGMTGPKNVSPKIVTRAIVKDPNGTEFGTLAPPEEATQL